MWISFIILLYILGNVFIVFRVLSWLKVINKPLNHKLVKISFLTLYSICAFIPILSFLLPTSKIQSTLQKFSNSFMGFYIYMFLMALVFCIVYFIFRICFKKTDRFFRAKKYLYTTCCISIVFISVMNTYGIIHAKYLTVKNYEVTIEDTNLNKDYKIVVFADLHLGYSVGLEMIKKTVKATNKENADLVLIAGDIFDNDYDSVSDKKEIVEELRKIKSKHGVYAVFGNHDISERLFGGFSVQSKEKDFRDPRMETFLTSAGIKVLDDEVELIDDSFYLVGRLDLEKPGDGTENRKSVKKLVSNLSDKPFIVLEHQPKNLDESSKENALLHLAGHTHDGQFFPLNLFGGLFYENKYGLLKKDNMTSIVTSGVGVYGPNIRVGTNSEIVSIELSFR